MVNSSSSSQLLDPEINFQSLSESIGLDNRLLKALQRQGYVRPTLVQSKCLPFAIAKGKDLLVRAGTGSGKTLAYCLPILHKILKSAENEGGEMDQEEAGFVKAVILVPTRELCEQVTNTIRSLSYYCDSLIKVTQLLSGNNSKKERRIIAQQHAMLRDEPNIIVSTPAGLLTHIDFEDSLLKNTLKLSVQSLVVDEADLVLAYGNANDVERIMKYLPQIFQGFLMSATLSPELDALKKVLLHSPVLVKLEKMEEQGGKDKKKHDLTQLYLTLPRKDKNLIIFVFLKLGLLKGKGLFFVNSVDGGYRLKLFLEQMHIRSAVLNSELPLKSRLNIIEQFNVGNFDYLIATDESTDANNGKKKIKEIEDGEPDNDEDDQDQHPIQTKKKSKKRKKDSEYGVSRGLDFRGVSFVVNVDFPTSPDSYTHRIGRTARGGAKGVALSLVEIDSIAQLDMLAEVQESQPPLPEASTSTSNNGNLHSSTTRMEDNEGGSSSNDIPMQNNILTLQPTALDFDLKEIEGFRYRVEDVSRAVTKNAVKETKAAELRAEILNSERLQNHFAENPSELQLLRPDRQSTHISKVQDHLKNVPKYLLPRGMQVANQSRRKRRKRKFNNKRGLRRTDNDPLQSFDGDNINLDGVKDERNEEEMNESGVRIPDTDEFDDPLGDGGEDEEVQNVTNKSTAGRVKWQEKKKRGKYSKTYQKKQKSHLGF